MQAPSPFAFPAFMRLWWARLAGTSANQILLLALGWQMYDLTGSAWDLGLVGLLQFAPAIPLALPAGHVIDRHHRARVLAVCLACQLVLALLLCAAAAAGAVSRALLLAVSVAVGVLRTFQMPTQQALTPSLVPPAVLPRALAFSASGLQASIIAGPAIGGVLFVAGPTPTYAACAALLAISTLLVLRVDYHHAPAAGALDASAMLAGLRYVGAHKVVLGAITLDMFAVLLGGATALLPIYAKDVLHVGPWGLGLLRSAPAAGALVMSIVLTRRPVRRRTGVTLLGTVAVYGIAQIAFGVATSFGVALVALAVSGAADMVSVVIRQTLVQLETPDEMRGRVSAVNSVFIGASNQLGEFRSGAMAEVWGAVASVVVGGIGTVAVAGLWWKLFPALAQRDRLLAEPRPQSRT